MHLADAVFGPERDLSRIFCSERGPDPKDTLKISHLMCADSNATQVNPLSVDVMTDNYDNLYRLILSLSVALPGLLFVTQQSGVDPNSYPTRMMKIYTRVFNILRGLRSIYPWIIDANCVKNPKAGGSGKVEQDNKS